MVNVLSNLNTILCHAFIKDLTFMPPIVDLFLKDELKLDDELPIHVQRVYEQENIQNVDMDIWYKFQALKFQWFEFKIQIVDRSSTSFQFHIAL